MSEKFANIHRIYKDNAEILRPPRRLTVPEAAEQHVYLDTPGGYAGPWKNTLPHYMVLPAECLTSRDYEAVVFSGPAQTAKTAMLVDNWMAHTITCDPADFMVVQTAQDTARDYSKRRVDRLIDASKDLKDKMRKGGSSDNTYDKFFRSGMILSLGWPTKNQLAGKAIGKMALTDYDRMPDDIDGEGAAFYLAKKRTTTFLSRGMTMAEGSPSKPILDPKWEPSTPHEAPPTKGILGLYNTGDRHRLYGKCEHCEEYYMPKPGIEAMHIPLVDKEPDLDHIGLICNNCGAINYDEREFKRSVVWLKEGQIINKDGEISGDGRVSKIASFFMVGWAAAFQSWVSIVRNYFHAKDVFDRTGDEEALKNATNLDMGAPYLDKTLTNVRSHSEIESRAEDVEKRIVPENVRFLLASVDVQKGRFVVQVEGFAEHLESFIIDRYNLKLSHRDNEEGQVEPISPGSHLEDWDVLISNVLEKKYMVEGTDKLMPVLKVACDSGGQEGVTGKAYDFWRKLARLGYAHKNPSKSRFILVKGSSTLNAPDIRESFPGANGRKDRKANARGEVPVYMINTNTLKDNLSNDLDRKDPGPRFIHFPSWLGGFFFAELTAEIRTPKGWVNPSRKRNESFDLMVYVRVMIKLIGADKINWENPPSWAKTTLDNPTINVGLAQQPRKRRVRSNGVRL